MRCPLLFNSRQFRPCTHRCRYSLKHLLLLRFHKNLTLPSGGIWKWRPLVSDQSHFCAKRPNGEKYTVIRLTHVSLTISGHDVHMVQIWLSEFKTIIQRLFSLVSCRGRWCLCRRGWWGCTASWPAGSSTAWPAPPPLGWTMTGWPPPASPSPGGRDIPGCLVRLPWQSYINEQVNPHRFSRNSNTMRYKVHTVVSILGRLAKKQWILLWLFSSK